MLSKEQNVSRAFYGNFISWLFSFSDFRLFRRFFDILWVSLQVIWYFVSHKFYCVFNCLAFFSGLSWYRASIKERTLKEKHGKIIIVKFDKLNDLIWPAYKFKIYWRDCSLERRLIIICFVVKFNYFDLF